MHEVMPMLAALIAILGVFAFLLLIFRGKQSVQKALIEKFSSARDLSEFLETPGGRRLMGGPSVQLASPLSSVLKQIRAGVVFGLLGCGFLLVHLWGIHENALTVFGVLLVCLGVGSLVSAGICYRLSKAWGLLEKPGQAGGDRPAGN